METIDLTSFKNAKTRLHEILVRYEKDNHDLDIRDAVIKRFEYTYSLALKMIYRYLRHTSPEMDAIPEFNEAIRLANQRGLLFSNLEKWNDYRLKRNMSSHTYDDIVAENILSIIYDFVEDVDFLYSELDKRL